MSEFTPRVLVTGDTGFLGRSLVRALSGARVWVLRKGRSEAPANAVAALAWDENDQGLSLASAFAEAQPDVAIHLAWRDIRDHSIENLDYNLWQGLSLTAAAADAGCSRVIHLGTAWECGGLTGPVDDNQVGPELSDFARVKVVLFERASDICSGTQTALTWARVFYCFGPGQHDESFLGSLAASLADPDAELMAADSNVAHDFIYSSDVTSALRMLVMRPDADGRFDIGTGKATNLRQIAAWAYNYAGRPYPEGVVAPAHNDLVVAPSRRLRSLGWMPQISIRAGVEQTMESLLTPNLAGRP